MHPVNGGYFLKKKKEEKKKRHYYKEKLPTNVTVLTHYLQGQLSTKSTFSFWL